MPMDTGSCPLALQGIPFNPGYYRLDRCRGLLDKLCNFVWLLKHARWQVGSVIVVAPIFPPSTLQTSSDRLIWTETMNHEGFVRQAGMTVGVAARTATDAGLAWPSAAPAHVSIGLGQASRHTLW